MTVAPAGIYVHLPFCPYICPYCDFAKWPLRRSQAERYLAALEAEIASAPERRGETVFLGGGTPNTYDPATIAALVRRVRERFAVAPEAEATIEVNPDLALCEGFAAYRKGGLNRLSIGVQSFDAQELRVLGRAHSPQDVATVVARARRAGFDNVSLDLIFGAPGTSVARWRRTLEAALALDPQHISTYGLTVEAGTPFAAWQARQPSAFAPEDLEAELYDEAISVLTQHGYEHYEISNFARPGFRSRHNANYWANGEYVGLGVGAASYLAGCRSVHTRDLEAYCEALERHSPIPGESEKLEGDAAVGEALMLALRTSEGVDLKTFENRYAIDVLAQYETVVGDLQIAGMVTVDSEHVRLIRAGRFVANDVCSAFLAG